MRRMAVGIRSRFLLVVLGGVIAPIAIAGAWLARSTRLAGETLLRARAEQSLADAATLIGHRWVDARSALLRLAENRAVMSALSERHDLRLGRDPAALAALQQSWDALDGVAEEVVVRDTAEVVRGGLGRPARPSTPAPPSFRIRLPVYGDESATQIGTLDVLLRLSSLLPASFLWAGIGGSVPALFEPGTTTSLLPVPMNGELLSQDGFEWGGERWIVAQREVDEPKIRLALAAPTGAFVEPFASAAKRGSLALLAAIGVAFALATLLTRRITSPLLRLGDAASAVSEGDLERRVEATGPPEIQRLALAFNTMTESLRRTVRQLSQREALSAVGEFAAALAHEVRNPLTSVRLDLERARERLSDTGRADQLVGQALDQIDRLDAVVSGSLRIARSGHLELTRVDLREPLTAALHAAEPAFNAKNASVTAVALPTDSVWINGNAVALEQLFLNVLLNAAHASRPGARAEVAVTRDGGGVTVRVRDEGTGIPAEQLPRVFEPFFTTKETGTGLGLPVAQRIVHAHGGSIRIESTVGVGTSVYVVLPADKPIRDRNDP